MIVVSGLELGTSGWPVLQRITQLRKMRGTRAKPVSVVVIACYSNIRVPRWYKNSPFFIVDDDRRSYRLAFLHLADTHPLPRAVLTFERLRPAVGQIVIKMAVLHKRPGECQIL